MAPAFVFLFTSPLTCTSCPMFSFDLSVFGLGSLCTYGKKDRITRSWASHTCVTWSAKSLFSFPSCHGTSDVRLFKLGAEVDLEIAADPRVPTTKLVCSNTYVGAIALSAPMMLLCYSFASASFTSRNPSCLSVDRLISDWLMLLFLLHKKLVALLKALFARIFLDLRSRCSIIFFWCVYTCVC